MGEEPIFDVTNRRWFFSRCGCVAPLHLSMQKQIAWHKRACAFGSVVVGGVRDGRHLMNEPEAEPRYAPA